MLVAAARDRLAQPAPRDPERQAGRGGGLPLGPLAALPAPARDRRSSARRHQAAWTTCTSSRSSRARPSSRARRPAPLGRLLAHLTGDLDPGRVAALHDRRHDGRAASLPHDPLRPGPGRLALRPRLLGHGRAPGRRGDLHHQLRRAHLLLGGPTGDAPPRLPGDCPRRRRPEAAHRLPEELPGDGAGGDGLLRALPGRAA